MFHIKKCSKVGKQVITKVINYNKSKTNSTKVFSKRFIKITDGNADLKSCYSLKHFRKQKLFIWNTETKEN